MLEEIKTVLTKTPGIKAREIVNRLYADYNISADKSEVNALLYHHKEIFTVDANYLWKAKVTSAYTTIKSGISLEGTILEILPPVSGKSGTRSWSKQDIRIAAQNSSEIITATIWNKKIDLTSLNTGTFVKMEYIIKEKATSGVTYNEINKLEIITSGISDLPF